MNTAVITTGGLGTRLLTSTKGNPKTMLPLFSRENSTEILLRPLIELIFGNLYDFGFRKFCIIVGSKTKKSILNHMTPDESFIELLKKRNNSHDKKFIRTLSLLYKKINNCKIHYISQSTPMGFGHALLSAKKFVGSENFLLHAGDAYFPTYDFLPNFINTFQKESDSKCTILLQSKKDLLGYGIAEILNKKNVNYVVNVEEKPLIPKSNYAILPVYLFNSMIFDALKNTKMGYNQELQVTDAIKTLIDWNQKVLAVKMKNKWFDIGTPNNYYKALSHTYRLSL